jgi:hypothetical protein
MILMTAITIVWDFQDPKDIPRFVRLQNRRPSENEKRITAVEEAAVI